MVMQMSCMCAFLPVTVLAGQAPEFYRMSPLMKLVEGAGDHCFLRLQAAPKNLK